MKRTLLALGIIGSLLVMATPAQAASAHQTVTVTSYLAPHPVLYTVTQNVTWSVQTAAQCHSLYPCFGAVTWSKGYTQGIGGFSHWNGDVTTSGTLSNGVKWRKRTIQAEFERCVVPGWSSAFCVRHVTTLWITIRTNNTWSHGSNTV